MSPTSKNLDEIRHSLAHILAAVVWRRYPGTKLGIGPTIENGFYYDFLFQEHTRIHEDDLPKLEQEMRTLIAEHLPFSGKQVTQEEAEKTFKEEQFKLDLIKQFAEEGDELSIYTTGDIFQDLCRGGHVTNTKAISSDAFNLTHIAGAYWRGDENKPMLTRIYGVAFNTKKELKAYLEAREEAKKRDHRKLGKEMGLFVFADLVGPGLPLYTPKGATILKEIKNFSRALRHDAGYQEVQTPQINKAALFKMSGHYEKYRDDMFKVTSHYTDEEYFLKPMNCPQHTQLYAAQTRSYRDLPIRYADFSLLYRDEKPGELLGLTRLRSFSQDDGHVFCREDQIGDEFERALSGVHTALKTYQLDYYVRLSFRDAHAKDNYLGTDALWEQAQHELGQLVKKHAMAYEIAEGEATFYGPKLDFIAKDSLGREWQLSTIQLDLNMPQRFNLEYIGEDGKKHTPVMIHSALIGSPERFLGILIEHYAGNFPLWLAPVQVTVLPVSEKTTAYAQQIYEMLFKKGVRTEINNSTETLGKRIRTAEIDKVPYVVVVGEREKEKNSVSVRKRHTAKTSSMEFEKFITQLQKEITKKT